MHARAFPGRARAAAWGLLVLLGPGTCPSLHAAEAAPAQPVLVAEVGHASRIDAVAVSADGRFVLTGSQDGTARLWLAGTGKELRRLDVGSAVTAVAFSPDSTLLLTGSADGVPRVWDQATGRVVRPLLGHEGAVTAATFSGDGAWILTGSADRTARAWRTDTGQMLRTYRGHEGPVWCVAIAPGGGYVATGSFDRTARIWHTREGSAVRVLTGHQGSLSSVAFERQGTHLLTAAGDKPARLWDIASGRTVQQYAGHDGWVRAAVLSPDGRRVATASEDGTAALWDAASGARLGRFEGHTAEVTSAAFTPDGRSLWTGSADRTARRFDVATRAETGRLEGHATDVLAVAFASDGTQVLTGSMGGIARRWDLSTGKDVGQFVGHTGEVSAVAFSPDCQQVLTGAEDRTARLWRAATGEFVRSFVGHEGCVCSATYSPDGAYVLTASKDRTARLWRTDTGNQVQRFMHGSSNVNAAVFSPDGRMIATGASDDTARLWRVEDGQQVRVLEGHADRVEALAFSPDGAHLLTGSRDRTARLWNRATGALEREFRGHEGVVSSVAFLADGARIVTGSWDGTVRLWDAATGASLHEFRGHTHRVTSVGLSPDGRFLLSGSMDGSARLWDMGSGAALCSLLSFRDGSWAVTDPTGRFDASQGGEIEGLHWVVGNEVISLGQLKARYYEPGLLAKVVGLNHEPLRRVEAFTAPRLYPDVQVQQDATRLTIDLEDLGGGIGEVVVMVNGKERTADARTSAADAGADHLTLVEDLAGDPRLVPGQPNRIEVFARNAEGYLRSRGVLMEITPEGEAEETELHALVVGVSDYRGAELDLRFAADDATAFGGALQIAGASLFGPTRTHVQILRDASREHLVEALASLRRAKASDVLVVYLAGHGLTHADAFYFLTADAASADLSDPAVRATTALSHDQLTAAINAIPALKQVLILDTCASAAVIEALAGRRGVPSSQLRALERVKDRTGMFVLAGCAADRSSFEDARFGQGLLTYSLLLGMKGGQLREGEYLDVAPWFQFASDRVRELAADIGNVQEPSVAMPHGGASFDIGRLDEDGRGRVPLKSARPVFLRTVLVDPSEGADTLGMGAAVDRLLVDDAARGPQATVMFVDSATFDGAYLVTGTYEAASGGDVHVRFRLRRDRVFVSDWIEASGPAARLPQVVFDEARRALRTPDR